MDGLIRPKIYDEVMQRGGAILRVLVSSTNSAPDTPVPSGKRASASEYVASVELTSFHELLLLENVDMQELPLSLVRRN